MAISLIHPPHQIYKSPLEITFDPLANGRRSHLRMGNFGGNFKPGQEVPTQKIIFLNIRMEHYFIINNSSNINQALTHKNFYKFLKIKKVTAILRFDR